MGRKIRRNSLVISAIRTKNIAEKICYEEQERTKLSIHRQVKYIEILSTSKESIVAQRKMTFERKIFCKKKTSEIMDYTEKIGLRLSDFFFIIDRNDNGCVGSFETEDRNKKIRNLNNLYNSIVRIKQIEVFLERFRNLRFLKFELENQEEHTIKELQVKLTMLEENYFDFENLVLKNSETMCQESWFEEIIKKLMIPSGSSSTKNNMSQISLGNSFSLNIVKSNDDIDKLLKRINFSPFKIVNNGGEVSLILSINYIKKDQKSIFPTYLITLPDSMSIRYKLSSVDIEGNIFGEIRFQKL